MNVAAVYARKSQADEENIEGQVRAARAFAAKHGWTIPDQYVYRDDGISGSVFEEGRPGFAALMAAVASPARGFDVLVVRDVDRIGREIWEIGRALQAIVEAEVRVFLYQTGEELKLDSPILKMMLSLKGFTAESYRDTVVKNTRAAGRERVLNGQVAGSRIFGYATKCGRCGGGHKAGKQEGCEKIRVRRVIKEGEREVVVRFFEAAAKGQGIHTIAKELNRDHIPGPRRADWSQGGIAAMLRNPIYIGKPIFGKTTTVKKKLRKTDPATWITKEHPELRIIPQDLWDKVQRSLDARRGARGADGKLKGRAPSRDIESKYLLTGFAVCGTCGGPIRATIRGTGSGAGRRFVPSYTCATFETKGTCKNNVTMRAADVERVVIANIAQYLDEDVVAPAVDQAVARLIEQRGPRAGRRQHLEAELAKLEQRGARLADAIGDGGELPALIAARKAVEGQQATLRLGLETLEADAAPVDPTALKVQILAYAKDVQALLAGTPHQARTVLRELLVGKVKMTPYGARRTRGYQFSGVLGINRVLEGDAGVLTSASAKSRAGR
jgi:site-specific DNA recombinase